jgi:hypothetical protein
VSEMANALFVKKTGHVLGVVTRLGDPLGTLAPDALAGAAFPVLQDSGDVLVEVEPAELDVKSVALIDDLLLQPQSCTIDVDNSVALVATGTAPTVTMDASKLSVDLGAAATEKVAVWAQVESGSGSNRRRQVFSAEIAQGDQTVDFTNSFTPGDYDVLALAAGALPALEPALNVP